MNLRNMSLRDLSSLLVQIARELQNRERGGGGGGFRPRGPQGPGSYDRGERPAYGGHRPSYGGGGGGGGGWKRGPRRERPGGGRYPGGPHGGPGGGGGFPGEGGPSDDAGNREGANEGRFGAP